MSLRLTSCLSAAVAYSCSPFCPSPAPDGDKGATHSRTPNEGGGRSMSAGGAEANEANKQLQRAHNALSTSRCVHDQDASGVYFDSRGSGGSGGETSASRGECLDKFCVIGKGGGGCIQRTFWSGPFSMLPEKKAMPPFLRSW